jgi:TP901 family phage tail tape measure protein
MSDAKLLVQIEGRDGLSQELKRIESGVIRFVGAVSSAFTAIAAFGFPIAESAKFQKELLNAAKTTEFSRDKLGVLKEGLVDLSKQVNITAVDLAKIATMGGQIGLGSAGPQALVEFTKTVATAVSALDLSAEEVVASFGKLINIFNIPPNQFRNAMSALNEVSNVSNATADQLFDVVRRIGNLGGSVTMPQATALSATMIDLGLTAETAGTTLTKIFADFKSNASEFASLVKSDTIPTTQAWVDLVAKDGIAALNAYIDALNKLPLQTASEIKGRLTGEGRLFEAVTKLQNQRRRELAVIEDATKAEQELAAIQEGRVAASEEEVKALKDRVDAIREAAKEANVLARLTNAAERAFRVGDSAEKEQRTMLAGLNAQWVIFLNNIKSLAMAAGDVFLAPLSRGLDEISKSLQNPVNADSIKRAAQDILEAIYTVIDAFKELRELLSGMRGSGIDFGAILKFSALLATLGAIKGLISLLKSIGATAIVAIPGLNALGGALFGTVQKAKQAGDGLNSVGEAAQRSGGYFRNAVVGIQAAVSGFSTASGRLIAVRNQTETALATLGGRLATTQGQIAALFSSNRMTPFRNITDAQQRILAMQNAINAAQVRYNAAVAAGASTRGARSNLNYLQAQLAQYQLLQAQASRYQNVINALTARAARVQIKLDDMTLAGQFNRLRQKIAAGAASAGNAFASSFSAGARVGFLQTISNAGLTVAAVKARWAGLVASAQQSSAGTATAFRNGFTALVTNAATASARTVSQLNLILAAAGRVKTQLASIRIPDLKVVLPKVGNSLNEVGGGLLAALSTALSGVGKALQAGVSGLGAGVRQGFSAIVDWAGAAALSATGFTKAWQDASTKTSKALVGVAAAFGLLGKAMRAVISLPLKLISLYFIGEMVVEVLKAIGVWDRLALSIQKAYKYMGMEPPKFLETEFQKQERATKEAEIKKAYEGANLEAGKFNKQAQITVALLMDAGRAAKELTFNVDDPSAANKNFAQGFDAIVSGMSRFNQMQGAISLNSVRLQEATENLINAQKRYNEEAQKNPASAAAVKARSEVILLEAEVNSLKQANQELGSQSTKTLTGLNAALKNLLVEGLSQGEADAFFGSFERNGTRSLSVVQQFLSNLKEVDRLKKQLETQNKALSFERDTGTSAQNSAAYQQLQADAQKTADALEEVEKANQKLTQSMALASQSGRTLADQLIRLGQTRDLPAVEQLVAQMQQVYATTQQFAGRRVQMITADNIVQAGVTREVTRRISEMYRSWQALAATNAERAKNYATQVAGEVERLSKNTIAFIDKISTAYQATRKKAADQIANRQDEEASRQRLRDIQTEYDVERALLEQKFAIQNRILAEQEAGGVRVFAQKQQQYSAEQQAMFELEEKYNKIKQLEADRLDIQKQRRAVQNELKQYDELIKKVDHYKKTVEEANKVIADEKAPVDKRLGAIERRQDAIDKLRSTYSLLEGTVEKLSQVEPIGGELLLSQQELNRITEGVQNVSETLGTAMLQDSDKIKGAYDAIANTFGAIANTYDAQSQAAFGRFAQLSQAMGAAPEAAAAAMSRLLASSQQFSTVVDEIKAKTNNGLINPSSINFDAIAESAKAAANSLGNLKLDMKAQIKLDGVQEGLAKEVQAGFLAGTKAALEQANTAQPLIVNPTLSQSGSDAYRRQIEESVSPVVEGTLKITDIESPNATVQVKTTKFARGGLVGDAINLSSQILSFARGGFIDPWIRRHAGGGAISGPGTGTSDSILARLSNGEYVIDAFTTAAFGPRFFRRLQTAARSGVSLNFLNNVGVPRFAAGGPVSARSSFSGIANDFTGGSKTATVRDVVDINLSLGGKRATIFAEREQAKAFVGILRNFEKGT